jgi:hypothetical protein
MAIAWCELMITPNQYGSEDLWPALRLCGIDEALQCIRGAMQEAIDDASPGKHAECLAATDTK